MKMISMLMLGLVLAVASARAQDVEREVIGEGSATSEYGDQRRQIALTAALQDAVRQAGTDLISASKVRDFILEYDRVFAQAFGHVRSYTVLKQVMESDGTYRVTVRAKVKPGAPALKDDMAIRMIVNLKNRPRIGILVNEQIEGIGQSTDFARSWIEQLAQSATLRVVDLKQTRWNNELQALKDEFNGDNYKAALRRLNVSQDYDFLITADLLGQAHGADPALRRSGLTAQSVSVGGDLRVIRPDTGETLVTVPLSGTLANSLVPDPKLAVRDVIHRELEGRDDGKLSGRTLFTRLLTQWVTDLDLGAVIQMEFEHLRDAERQALIEGLRKTDKITQVWPGEFSARGLSRIDIESRLDADSVRGVILKLLDGSYELSERTTHYLQFIPTADRQQGRPRAAPAGFNASGERVREEPAAETIVTTVETVVVDPSPASAANVAVIQSQTEIQAGAQRSPEPAKPLPPWVWILGTLGAVAVAAGLVALIRR